MNTDHNREMEAVIASLGGARPRLLLHACCAPCTSSVIERLYPHFRVTLFYFNPNIHPREEYEKRAAEFPKLLRGLGMEDVELIVPPWEPDAFLEAARGLEDAPEGGARCGRCFDLRLSETAKLARAGGYDWFCTTLTVSPHKDARIINEIGRRLASDSGVPWLPSDFKKRDGYLRSIRLCREYGIYRQCFCGCVYSASRT